MSQLNIHVTPDFDRALKRYMRERGIKTKSEAVRAAVNEALAKKTGTPRVSWEQLLGAGNRGQLRPKEEWITEDELWEDDGR